MSVLTGTQAGFWKAFMDAIREAGEVPSEIVERAEAMSSSGAERPDRALLLNGADEWAVCRALAAASGCQTADPVSDPPSPDALAAVPRQIATRLRAVPLRIEDGSLVVAIADPLDIPRLSEISVASGRSARPVLTTRSLLEQAIRLAYPSEELQSVLDELGASSEQRQERPQADAQDDRTPVARLFSSLIDRAIRDEASDIHIQPRQGASRVRFRIDGVLHDVAVISPSAHDSVVARIKALSGMDVADKMRPQDGRMMVSARGIHADARVATLPTPFGEQVVLRILRTPGHQISLKKLGMSDEQAAVLHAAVERTAGGLILVCGPTGAGKTTTLYSLLQRCNTPDRAVATVEDPVEYEIPGVTQISVNQKAGMTYAAALRGILRSDPDVIMVGEIRDLETARLCIEASLTGHTVLTTLHTRTAPGAVDRLLQMGLEHYMLASSIAVVVAQRLVRTVCRRCAAPEPIPAWAVQLFPKAAKAGMVMRGRGCPECRWTGYRGRTGVFEVLNVTDTVREAIATRQPEPALAAVASLAGYSPMLEDADSKVALGVTTPEEVLRSGITDREPEGYRRQASSHEHAATQEAGP